MLPIDLSQAPQESSLQEMEPISPIYQQLTWESESSSFNVNNSPFPSPLQGAPSIFNLFFTLFILVFLGIVLAGIVGFINNASQPQVSRAAWIVSKRQCVSSMSDGPTRTSYYITFEFPDSNREELSVGSREYGLLVEGDRGTLRSQGSWFKGFDRTA